MICLHKRLACAEAAARDATVASSSIVSPTAKRKEETEEKKCYKMMAHNSGFTWFSLRNNIPDN
jgi:hypothetical protein